MARWFGLAIVLRDAERQLSTQIMTARVQPESITRNTLGNYCNKIPQRFRADTN